MTLRKPLSLNRRLALGGLMSLPLAARAWAESPASLPLASCETGVSRVKNTLYEYDLVGKAVEWDYPSGKPTRNGLTMKGLGLQKTNSVKNTSSGFTDTSALADRFLNLGEWVDWHPTSLWALQFGAKAAIALERDDDIVAATSISDEYFGFHRVGGVNPTMLSKAGPDPDFAGLMKPGKDYYMVDYQSLIALEDNDSVSDNEMHIEGQIRRYGHQPKALFVADNNKLMPVAIQMRRDENSVLVKPGDAKWDIAKFIVQNADFNYHQLAAHLGRTHLYMEALAVATGISLPQDVHPVSKLLRPHFEGTINITDFATTDLINISPQASNGGIFDHNFTGTMASNIQFIAEEVFGLYDQNTLRSNPVLARRAANLFNDSLFPRDIVRRGVGHFTEDKIRTTDKASSPEIGIIVYHAKPGVKPGSGPGFDYPFLQDACPLWNAITDWVCRYVAAFYQSDDDIKADCELQDWAKTAVEGGKILGLGEYKNGSTLTGQIQTRSYLVQVLSQIIFTASVQHTAVNFPQADYGPTMPAGIYRDFFAEGDAPLSDYLPNAAHFKEVMELWSVLSASQYTELGKYHDNTSSGKKLRSVTDYFDRDDVLESRKLFRKTLKAIEKKIEKREGGSRTYPYKYLLPSLLPQSVNV